jgi:hypothetical protein
MRFHVRHVASGGPGDALQSADLVDDVGGQVLRCGVDEASAEPGEVAVGHLRPDAHASLGREPARAQQQRGVAGVEAACDVGAGDDAEHGVVVAQRPYSEALAEVGVEVDLSRCHVTSLSGTIEAWPAPMS